MYIVINKTTGSEATITGDWPIEFFDSILNSGNDIIVISTYSNTIKVPRLIVENGVKRYKWTDYPFNPNNL